LRLRTCILIGVAVLAAGCATGIIEPVNPTERSASSTRSSSLVTSSLVPSEVRGTNGNIDLPRRTRLDVPFSSQAPDADWTDPRKQEGCEEMSVIMVHHFLKGTGLPDPLGDLIDLSTWESENGYSLDVNVEELAAIVEDYYGHKTAVSDEVTFENIAAQIAAGNPVIVPAAGRKLGNPYFSGEGPWYHMLVITGYDNRYFYTNDPGTRRGDDYKYEHDVVLNAVHDWTGVKEEIETGRKVMLTILP